MEYRVKPSRRSVTTCRGLGIFLYSGEKGRRTGGILILRLTRNTPYAGGTTMMECWFESSLYNNTEIPVRIWFARKHIVRLASDSWPEIGL